MLASLKQVFYGKLVFQTFFETLQRISLRGLNIGEGGSITKSGELHALYMIRKFLEHKNPITIFDVGANEGEYSEAVLKVFLDKPFRLFAFEPSKTAFASLSANKSLKHATVSLINKGMSDTCETATLYSNGHGSKLGSIYPRTVPGKKFNITEEISTTTIDDFCKQQKIECIDFLKLDIEGNELVALQGASKMIEQGAIEIIQYEFGGTNIDARTYFRDFWDILSPTYRIFRILKDGLREIVTYNEKLELFSATNYLAIKKQPFDAE